LGDRWPARTDLHGSLATVPVAIIALSEVSADVKTSLPPNVLSILALSLVSSCGGRSTGVEIRSDGAAAAYALDAWHESGLDAASTEEASDESVGDGWDASSGNASDASLENVPETSFDDTSDAGACGAVGRVAYGGSCPSDAASADAQQEADAPLQCTMQGASCDAPHFCCPPLACVSTRKPDGAVVDTCALVGPQ
jgi:hypothetical protein